jgi:hypothetical protein
MERVLVEFLKRLQKEAFIKSTNSITGKEENLNPEVEDMEAVIKINGEWDREDLKGILLETILFF